MINLSELLKNIVNEMTLSEFNRACDNAGINDVLRKDILNMIAEEE